MDEDALTEQALLGGFFAPEGSRAVKFEALEVALVRTTIAVADASLVALAIGKSSLEFGSIDIGDLTLVLFLALDEAA